MTLKLLPGNISRDVFLNEDMPLLRWNHNATGSWATGLLLSQIRLSAPIAVSTCINGMLEQALQGHAVGATPFELTFALAGIAAHAQLNVVLHEILQHRSDRAESLKLVNINRMTCWTCLSGSKPISPVGV
jgi:hypothetical protein